MKRTELFRTVRIEPETNELSQAFSISASEDKAPEIIRSLWKAILARRCRKIICTTESFSPNIPVIDFAIVPSP